MMAQGKLEIEFDTRNQIWCEIVNSIEVLRAQTIMNAGSIPKRKGEYLDWRKKNPFRE